MTIHFVSLYFDIESQGILEKKLEMKMAGNPLYILYSDDDSCRAIAPIIRTENFFLECYDGMEEIRSLVIHNRDPVNPDIIVNATCTLNECNQKINIYHSSPFGKDVATAWYGKRHYAAFPISTEVQMIIFSTGGATPVPSLHFGNCCCEWMHHCNCLICLVNDMYFYFKNLFQRD